MSILHSRDTGLYEAGREHDACGIGAVINIGGVRSHEILEFGRQVLLNLRHRGAAGSDETTGDGAGILFQIPHEFFVERAGKDGIALGKPGSYGVGMVFGSTDSDIRRQCDGLLSGAIEHYGLKILGWREVPVDNTCLGELARSGEPSVKQVFIDGAGLTGESLERALFMGRKRAERLVRERFGEQAEDFYVVSMSCRTICYKGLFLAPQLFGYYPDLSDRRVVSALAMVHQRYSTNTFPNWRLAQPFRMIAHNGEINTISGNANHIRSCENRMKCGLLGDDLGDLIPILTPYSSDSAQFDNAAELFVRAGRSLPHTMMMMIPEAFGLRYHISADKRAFYEYHAAIMAPWDGPAAMMFTDGRMVGSTLDRNGLRPCRYIITTDDLVVLSSEVGVIDFPPDKIRSKGCLRPGRMFLVDTEEGRIIPDNEIKGRVARSRPYRNWLMRNRIELRGLFAAGRSKPGDPKVLLRQMQTFGYTREDQQMILIPMALNAQESIGSMGADTPLAVLSDRPKLLFDYFKQMFAQVTNPPIDPLREGLVMSLMSFTGKRLNLLDETPRHCRQLKLPHPILTNDDMERLRAARRSDFKVSTVDALFDADGEKPGEALERGLDELVNSCEAAIRNGSSLVIISDRNFNETRAPIPSLLAMAAVHQGLLDRACRSEAGLVIETGEAREVMHFCLLCGYGANAVNPYLAFETLIQLQCEGDIPEDIEPEQIADNYIAAIKKGILKTMSKMGISTLRSYHSAKLFEAVGLGSDVVNKYFTGTSSRISGAGMTAIAREVLHRHSQACSGQEPQIDPGGERHLWNPKTVSLLNKAVQDNDRRAYDDYTEIVSNQSGAPHTLRNLFEFVPNEPVSIDEVEAAESIVRRFCTSAMSHGSVSREVHETITAAMNRLGATSNTGEGGEDPRRYKAPRPGSDSLNAAVKQVASGRFGVTMEYLAHAEVLQIKMAQGAKPGEGGQLPGKKVTDEIARLRHSIPGVTLISPPPHHDVYSIEDLAQLIYDLKCSNPGVKVSVKLACEVGVGTVAVGVVKGNADEVLVSAGGGGTGASPLSSIKHAGIPWELGLAEVQQTLVLNGLRDRICLKVDGQLMTGRDVVIATLLGAERFGFGTAALVSLGCRLCRKCHLGACPVGIGTQKPELRKRFTGRPEHLQRFMFFIAEEVRRIMARLGFRKLQEMIGRVDRLRVIKVNDHWKSKDLDLSVVLSEQDTFDGRTIRHLRNQNDVLKTHLDLEILSKVGPAIDKKQQVQFEMPIRNIHRTVGTIMSNRIVLAHGAEGLPDGTIDITLSGSAGQSFGAFLVPGVTFRLIGEANDYLGKGLSGGRITVQPPPDAPLVPHKNVIAGNALLYGATAGEVFINGLAGERFAVRNSGATAVVEGLGDHGCEYMTRGTVVVIGPTGRNFAAGMSGGVAYVLDEHQLFDTLCNLDTVNVESVWYEKDISILYDLISRHYKWTGSPYATQVLAKWRDMVGMFVKVVPIDYQRSLQRIREREDRQTDTTPATEEVFGG
ncbi:MAG: glutamate synthase large subunit [Planctomycetota bacterium]|nr:glutamate synthase large subunit [Planctomycetota bacterium]